ncbi:hypothetical protein LZG04_30535 [Saccharothrix sp. S26]|uniref:hypothetical protein n=1 Tax=Saccharothrix sp. S26 TaxID=2907215 RepID=UPI001F192B9C|nr:hypothetical protein [Saccharothrix sp. S26]MCE6999110.1 hypothetical protein [Saccharothrix sp. S26]
MQQTHPAAPTGGYHESGTAHDATCTSILSSGTGTRVFTWDDPAPAPSTFTYSRSTSRVAGTIVVLASGTITAGSFAPSRATSQGTGLQPDVTACLTDGASTLNAVGALIIGL